jgi:hypothetical protein
MNELGPQRTFLTRFRWGRADKPNGVGSESGMRRASGLLQAIRARRDELVDEAARQSFPASDPPAFGIEDDGLAVWTARSRCCSGLRPGATDKNETR